MSTWIHRSLAITGIVTVMFSCLPAESKEWSTDDRQTKLMQDINEGQKSKELTLKEANKLRKDLSHVARNKAKMKAKAKSKGALTAEQESEMESQINKISVEIQKCKLEKRLQTH